MAIVKDRFETNEEVKEIAFSGVLEELDDF